MQAVCQFEQGLPAVVPDIRPAVVPRGAADSLEPGDSACIGAGIGEASVYAHAHREDGAVVYFVCIQEAGEI